ncbi:MAG: hypothetical protein ACR2J6_02040, partial [Thermoleophilaceae bacterium]
MRRRLLFSTALIALVAIVVLGVPLGVVESHRLRGESRTRLKADADRVAVAIDDKLERRERLDRPSLAGLVRPGHELSIGRRGRPVISIGTRVREGRAFTERSALAHGAIVTAQAPLDELDERIRARWLFIAVLS